MNIQAVTNLQIEIYCAAIQAISATQYAKYKCTQKVAVKYVT